MARHVSDLPTDPVVVVTNPEEDCSPAAFRAMLDELVASGEPQLDSIGAAEVVRELRTDAGA